MENRDVKEQLNEIEHIKLVRQLAGKIENITIAMLTTTSISGQHHCRPMYTHQIEDDGVIWFFAHNDSRKVADIKENPNISLVYSKVDSNLHVSINGIATISYSLNKISELWTEKLNIWFPGGKTDPNIALIRIEPYEAEYWDLPNSLISQIINIAKSTLVGEAYIGENKKFDLSK